MRIKLLLLLLSWAGAACAEEPSTFLSPPAPPISIWTFTGAISFRGGIVIYPDGRLKWHGRWVRTDREFRAAMLQAMRDLHTNSVCPSQSTPLKNPQPGSCYETCAPNSPPGICADLAVCP